MKPVDLHAPVTENLDLGGGNFLTTLAAPAIAAEIQPGQFVMVGTVGIGELLLRRPFSVCLVRDSRELQILYRVVGKGTALFSRLSRGAELAVLGPLGCGFTDPAPGEWPILVAGGIGIAAFPFFVEHLARSGVRPVLCYGGRTRLDLPLLDWLSERCDVHVTTDDGSAGERGLVVAPLRRLLAGGTGGAAHLYSCGPHPMLRAVAAIAEEAGVVSEAALEAPMACGFGVCLGCVVEAVNPVGEYGRYRRVCVEGPVFPTREIRW